MHIYTLSPDLFKKNHFNEDYEDWMSGCFKSKWDKPKAIDEEDEIENDFNIKMDLNLDE